MLNRLKTTKPQTHLQDGCCETEFQRVKTADSRSPEFMSASPKNLKKNKVLLKAVRPYFCSAFFLQVEVGSKARKGGVSCWGNRLPDGLLRYLDEIPHGLHGRRLGSWLGARSLVAWLGLHVLDWREVPYAHYLSLAPSAAAFCIWPQNSLANHFRGFWTFCKQDLRKAKFDTWLLSLKLKDSS